MPSNQFHRVEKLVGDCEAWQAVTFENSWVNYDGVFYDAEYYKDPFGVVSIRGGIKTGSSTTTAFTLPSGYRPSARLIFPVLDGAGFAYCRVNSDGTVVPVGSGVSTYVILDPIRFRAEQ